MKYSFFIFILAAIMCSTGFSQNQNHYNTNAGNGYGFRFWGGNDAYKIHMGNSTEYKYGGVTDYSIKMNMSDNPTRGWVWGVAGQTPIASLNTQGDFHFNGELYANDGWLRVKANRGLFFQDYGGGLFMKDDTWIRTYGNKSFYHNSGIMRTDGRFEVGPSGDRFRVLEDGNVGIGTTTPDAKLTVKGNIHAEEVKVDLSVPGPDYVFKGDYELKSLEEVQNYIKENGHLPNIPSAMEMEANGVELGIMNMKLLEKIEELTLYVIELKKENEEIRFLRAEIELIKQQLKDD